MKFKLVKFMSYVICAFLIGNIWSCSVMAEDNTVENNEGTDFHMYFTDIRTMNIIFSIKDAGKANIRVATMSRGTKIEIKTYLQQYDAGNWRNIKIWRLKSNRSSGQLDVNYYLTSGYRYRVKSYVYVYDMNGKLLESASKTSKEVKY